MTQGTNRRRLLTGAALVAAAIAVMAGPCTADVVQPRGLVREAVFVPFSQPGGATLRLEAIVARPATAGRFPLVVISHGSPRRISEAKKRSLDWADWIADDFARRGWAAATVLRRGFGNSEGAVADAYGTCSDPHYRAAGLSTAEDIVQAVSYFQKQPYVDPTRVLLVGVSAGGFGSIAAASIAPAWSCRRRQLRGRTWIGLRQCRVQARRDHRGLWCVRQDRAGSVALDLLEKRSFLRSGPCASDVCGIHKLGRARPN